MYICNMKKGDKIEDIRNGSTHTVECVDFYDEVTLVFTTGKKYIPIELTKVIMESEVVDCISKVIREDSKRMKKDLRKFIDKLKDNKS